MASRYGALWTNQHGVAPSGVDEGEWGDAISGLSEDHVRAGFHADLDRGSDFPPSSAKLRAMCLPPKIDAPRTYLGSPPSARRQLTAIESEQARVTANRELGAMCKRLGIDRAALTVPQT